MDEQNDLHGELLEFIRKNRIPQHPLSRRQFLRGGSTLALTLASISAVGGAPAVTAAADWTRQLQGIKLPEITKIPKSLMGTGELKVATGGGALAAAEKVAFWDPFYKLSGIRVIDTGLSADPATIKTQVDTNNVQYDVIEIDQYTVLTTNKHAHTSYFEPLDYGLMDTADIDANHRHPYAVDMLPYTWVNAYRTDAFPTAHPRGWQQWWDTKRFPGRRTLPGGAGTNPFLEGALIAAGVPVNKIYPINVDAAFNSLDKIRHSVVKWWTDGQTPAQLLTSKEVVLANAWNGRVQNIKGAPVAVDWYQGMLASDTWCVLRGAPNKVNAMKCIAFMMLPISQARMSMLINYGFTNRRAAEYIPQARLAHLNTGPNQLRQQFRFNPTWWANNFDAVMKRWATWVLGM